jgi:predicted O-methyltransferase YrrM
MEFIDIKIEAYSLAHSQTESDILKKINRETHAKVLMPRMLSGYSAICLAQGLQENGKLHTVDINEELENMVRGFINEAGMDNKITYYIGNALKIIPSINETFDIVFIDADKKNYSNYYDLVFDKVRNGGYIIADNVLWSGKVLDDIKKMDKETKAIDAFNKKVSDDIRVENMLLPVRDGLMIARKK